MNRYSILCTEEQTKKALELGAPIEECSYSINPHVTLGGCRCLIIPTAEQMIGWLEQNPRISDIDIFRSGSTYWAFYVIKFCGIIESKKEYFSRKEATLVAIDEALDYLAKTMEKKP